MQIAFEGRHVVVTGASGELGSAVARALLAAGAIVHAPVRRELGADRIVSGAGGALRIVPGVEATDPTAVDAFYGGIPALWGSVHCVGGFEMGPIAETSAESWEKLLSRNATSCFLACRAAIRGMRLGGGGRVVNVAAAPALEPRRGAGMAAYTASKAAVAALTVALAEEVAADAIWVNAVVPSILDTAANRRAMPAADPSRWASLDEASATIAFLASPQNRVTRGALVPVFGPS